MSGDESIVSIDDALDGLKIPRDATKRRKHVAAQITQIVDLYHEEAKADIPTPADDRECRSQIARAAGNLKKELDRITEGAFAELFGHDEAPLKEADFDELLDRLKRLLEANAITPAVGKSKPGPHKDEAIRSFVESCWELFDEHRPGQASTTLGGSFEIFVSNVYEIATGEPERDLGRQVRRVISLVKPSND